MNKLTNSALIVMLFFGLSSVAAAEDDCKKLKAQVEQELSSKGESSSRVHIYETVQKVKGKEIGFCGGGEYKVVVVEVDPA